MVDVTILLYLPINTSLDDLAFVADWSHKIVASAEEKMILNGKNNRYMRQRVMPMMYNPNNNIRPVNAKAKTRENTESWLKLLKKQDKEALPSWVKSHNLIDEEQAEREAERLAEEKRQACQENELCDCADCEKVNRKNYLDVIREAVQFTYVPNPVINTSRKNLLDGDSEDDSIFSDASSVTDENTNPKVKSDTPLANNPLFNKVNKDIQNSEKEIKDNKDKQRKRSRESQNSTQPCSNNGPSHKASNTSIEGDSAISNRQNFKSKYGSNRPHGPAQSKKARSNSCDGQSDNSNNSRNSNGSDFSRVSNHVVSTNKHVILSVAMGYDRDSMKEVRKVINETGVALLSVGIGDRGMIGLGGYYIKKLSEITTLESRIVNRLWNLA